MPHDLSLTDEPPSLVRKTEKKREKRIKIKREKKRRRRRPKAAK